MVRLYSATEIEIIKKGGSIIGEVFRVLRQQAQIGVALKDLDETAYRIARKNNAQPAFLGYRPSGARKPYGASICASINDVIVHGLPTSYELQSGDVLKIDFGIFYKGYYSDSAITLGIGSVSKDCERLITGTKKSLEEALRYAKAGHHLGDIGWAVAKTAKQHKLSVVRGLTGHGVGLELHEEPTVYNYGQKGQGTELKEGMVLAIEPMLSLGSPEVLQLDDESWATADGSYSAQFEHTVAITKKEPHILTI